jgi:hypothetical protein
MPAQDRQASFGRLVTITRNCAGINRDAPTCPHRSPSSPPGITGTRCHRAPASPRSAAGASAVRRGWHAAWRHCPCAALDRASPARPGALSHGWPTGRRCGRFPLGSLDRPARLIQNLLFSFSLFGGRLRDAAVLLRIQGRNSVERGTGAALSCSSLGCGIVRVGAAAIDAFLMAGSPRGNSS